MCVCVCVYSYACSLRIAPNNLGHTVLQIFKVAVTVVKLCLILWKHFPKNMVYGYYMEDWYGMNY